MMPNHAGGNGTVLRRLDRLEKTTGQLVRAVVGLKRGQDESNMRLGRLEKVTSQVVAAVVALDKREAENHRSLRAEFGGLRQEFNGLRQEFRQSQAVIVSRLDRLIEEMIRSRTHQAELFGGIERRVTALEKEVFRKHR